MALLQELYQDLTELSNKIKVKIDPKDVEEFQNTLNRSVPSTNSPDWLRYEEFRLSFQKGGRRMIIDIRKCEEDDFYRSRILWTSANYIVQEFDLEDILYIEWQRDKYYKVYLKQVLDDLPDPIESGYSFEYKLNDTPKQKQHYRQRLTASMPTHSNNSTHSNRSSNSDASTESETKPVSRKTDEGFIHVGPKKTQKKTNQIQNKSVPDKPKGGKKYNSQKYGRERNQDRQNNQERQIDESPKIEIRRSAPDIPSGTEFKPIVFKPMNVGQSWADIEDDEDGIF
jgi:hypothetical protein